MKQYLPFILLLSLLLNGCKDEAELPDYNLYFLQTDTPIVDNYGVTFTASLKKESSDEIIERGFIITHNYDLDNWFEPRQSSVETHSIPLDGEFSLKIEDEWDVGIECSVHAYMKTSRYNYRGEEVHFTPRGNHPPIITSVTIEKLDKYGRFTIHGKHFSKHPSRNKVYLNEVECIIKKATETELQVAYSVNKIETYYLRVITRGVEVKKETPLDLPGIKIKSISPPNIRSGKEFTIQVEDYDRQSMISVSVGGQSAEILEENSQEIRCLCPTIPDGKDTEVCIYLSYYNFSTPGFKVQVDKVWEKQNATASGSLRYQVIENEAYSVSEYGIQRFNKRSCYWEYFASFPEPMYPEFFFGKGDYLYVGGPDNTLFKYYIPGDKWEKCTNEVHPNFSGITMGEWIDDEYYISSLAYDENWNYKFILIKYSPETDTWTEFNDNIDGYYRFFNVSGKTYCLSGNELYEYDIRQRTKGKLFYTFPLYSDISSRIYDIKRTGNIMYFDCGHYDPMYLFGFDFSNKTFKSYGTPINYFYGFTFVLLFNEGMFVGCNQDYVYKYIGE
ncbi:IPT/TIG domain-containing protein [Bacteroides sp. OttesenSCG-928-J23]|nr:IPT/TIG domain-containing protein [Bacteroides sp. OttesenSCG-928-J23]MDL2299563.1 IPT/TIG domain-containing protein [Bacteroides sp. OttesenSCG-928-E20]MDL2305024.1 IPT/TIG domain-containing protein [Bacteroides sp. OttesenSCG-928-D19]